MILLDTCILIEHFKGNVEASAFLSENSGNMKISSVTDMEISQGVRNKAELKVYDKLLTALGIQVIEIDEPVSLKARLWVREYGLSHSLYLADALIAATASQQGLQLATYNTKDFKFLDIDLVNSRN